MRSIGYLSFEIPKIRQRFDIARPLFFLFILVVLFDFVLSYIKVNNGVEEIETEASIAGIIKDINLDAEGNIKSILIGNTLCYVNKVKDFKMPSLGTYVSVSGTISSFKSPMNLGSFDQKTYNASRGIYYYMYSDEIKIISSPKLHMKIKNIFFKARVYLCNKVNENCTFEGGTINTLLLGDKSGMDEERKNLYQAAGVGHFLVISGLHISVIGVFIYEITRKIVKRITPSCLVSILFLILYGMLVGFSISVLRAIIMYTVRLLSFVFKESYDLLTSVAVAGIITLIFKPLMVLDSSFVYSYSTVIIIGVHSTYFSKDGLWDGKKAESIKSLFLGKLLTLLKIPIVLSAFMLPVTLWFSYSYSVFSVLVNVFLAPLSAPILLLSFLSLFFSILSIPFLTSFFDFLLTLILRLLDKICVLSTRTNISVISGKPSALRVICFYLLILTFLFLYRYMERHKGGNLLIKIPVLLGMMCIFLGKNLYIPQISMLYVGQGECVVVRTAVSSAVVFDMGSTSEKDIAKYTVIPFLKASGIRTIDGIFVSHSDEDHISGVIDFINSSLKNGINIKGIYVQNMQKEQYDKTLNNIMMNAKNNGVKVYPLKLKDKFTKRGWTYNCVWPGEITGDSNGDSLAILASYKRFKALFTGDITQATEKKMLNSVNLGHLDLLKVAHHGSKTATSEEFLMATKPKLAIISAGINNRYNHPNEETKESLYRNKIPFYCTKESGEIDVFIKNKRIYIKEFLHRY